MALGFVHTFMQTSEMLASGFDWDNGNRLKCQKHGVGIADTEFVFRGSPSVVPDMKHSKAEDRFVAVGWNPRGRALFVAFTYRERDGLRLIRPVSARFMHKKESEAYAEKSPLPDER